MSGLGCSLAHEFLAPLGTVLHSYSNGR